ncbi:MAG TPA: segregation/condensation protein A, partial [Phycisphaerae bacterium]|nr:segregation/condensation protein A [Phycisphaerae bacterium]
MIEDYRVKLDVYNGPLDLLLYLIRREEVDIYDIPIASVTEQYLQYVELIKTLDPDLAGEFMVMAATLLEIKTLMLLPTPQFGDDAEGVQLDPRAELVRQLLQYKAFKDAAAELEDSAAAQALKFARPPAKFDGNEEASVDLEDVQIWDLFDAFSRIMESIGHRPTHHEVIYDDTPVELHAADILDRLSREGPMTFDRI